MELTQLRYFIEVAKRQHVTKAAQALNIAQPALSQAIHRLENELGVPLFTLTGRNIKLNPYGEYFYSKVEPLIKSLEELPDQIKIMADSENSTIRLNVLAASTLVTDAIIEYQKKDSSLHIQLMQNEAEELYDICITTKLFFQEPENKSALVSVYTEKIFLAVPNTSRFKGRTSVTLKEVSDMDFISLLGSRQLRSICDKYCQNAGIKPNIIFESDSPAAVKNMIAANMGIGFWPEFSWGRLDNSKVLLLEITEPVCSRDILITCRKNKQDNSRVEQFYEFLKDYFDRTEKEGSIPSPRS